MPPSLGNKLKLGIIGCGWATVNLHLPALRRLPHYEVVALADTNYEQAQIIGTRFQVPHRFRDASELMSHPAVEAIGICVPPPDHAALASAAIKTGKHVFIEKPLALTLEEADRLVEMAGHTRAKVLVGFNLRWHRLIRQAKAFLDTNGLGTLTLIRTVFTNSLLHDARIPAWRRERASGGGVIQDLAVHHFDLWRFLLGTEVEEISVSGSSKRWEDEAAVLSARMTNGVLVSSVFASGTSECHELECFGETGRLRVCCYDYDGLKSFANRNRSLLDRLAKVVANIITLSGSLARMRHGGEISASYDAQWSHFYDCMRNGTTVGCTVKDGQRAVELAVAARESLLSGHSISLKP